MACFFQSLHHKHLSLYYRHAHEKQAEFLRLFDAANVAECYERSESIIPQQALALANSSLVESNARTLAAKLPPQEDAFVPVPLMLDA